MSRVAPLLLFSTVLGVVATLSAPATAQAANASHVQHVGNSQQVLPGGGVIIVQNVMPGGGVIIVQN